MPSSNIQQSKPINENVFVLMLAIFLIVLTVSSFSYHSYQSVRYLLSQSFNVQDARGSSAYNMYGVYGGFDQSTLLEFFAGLLGIIASILLFIGSVFALKMSLSSLNLLMLGSIIALVKNVLDIVNDVNPLFQVQQVTSLQINSAAWAIGTDIFHIAFWVFVLVFFSRKSITEKFS